MQEVQAQWSWLSPRGPLLPHHVATGEPGDKGAGTWDECRPLRSCQPEPRPGEGAGCGGRGVRSWTAEIAGLLHCEGQQAELGTGLTEGGRSRASPGNEGTLQAGAALSGRTGSRGSSGHRVRAWAGVLPVRNSGVGLGVQLSGGAPALQALAPSPAPQSKAT